jgi:hypothetical protein
MLEKSRGEREILKIMAITKRKRNLSWDTGCHAMNICIPSM